MRFWLSMFLVIILLAFALPAAAQSTITMERLQIDIWPEFDRPEVLVILRATLSGDTPLPARLSLRIPQAAGNPFTLAMQDMDGMLFNLPYETETSDDWVLVSFTTPSPNIQLEYYDPSLQLAQEKHSYNFLWQTDYPAEVVILQIQQPWGSTGMRITPDLGTGRKGADDYTYFTAPLGTVGANSAIRVYIEYTLPETAVNATGIPVQPVTPLDEPISGRMDIQKLMPWGLVALGVLLLAGGIFWYIQGEHKSRKPDRKRHSSTANLDAQEEKTKQNNAVAGSRRITGPLDQPHVYCHRCGKRAQRGDVYCRTCGTKFRFE